MVRSTKGSPALCAGFPIRRILAVTGIALATANCSTAPQKFAAAGSGNGLDPKYGVKASPRLYNEGDVIPKGGGRRFSGKPYVVAGRTYVPKDDARGYVREGLASWYGAAFHGRQTANGEVFDRHSIAAAHPTLPLPSYARVTNLANGRSMVVRVNDRGPYHADRVMDVSEAVADALEFRRSGTSKVRVEYVGKASVSGSDDRKLLATLRTDGSPAPIGGRSPIMVADLGPERSTAASEEPLARTRAPLAFRPPEAAEPEVAEEAPRPRRAAPVLVASAAVAVPAALQPGMPRASGFKPSPIAATHGRTVAAADAKPLALVSPRNPVVPHGAPIGAPLRLASAGAASASFGRMASNPASGLNPGAAAKGVPMRLAGKAPAIPETAKQAMARLASLPPEPPRKGAGSASASAAPKATPGRRSRFAGIDD